MVEHFKRTEKVLEQVTSHRGLRFQLLTWGRHRDPLRDMLSSSVHVNKALGMEQVPPEQSREGGGDLCVSQHSSSARRVQITRFGRSQTTPHFSHL